MFGCKAGRLGDDHDIKIHVSRIISRHSTMT
jgi:hypothetical protein